jgi:hypothetical protein
MNAALDHRNPLLMFQDQFRHSNHATNNDRDNRNKKHTQAKDRFHQASVSIRKRLANDGRPTTNDGFSGGADRDRTGGLLVANQALSQLSYSPKIIGSQLSAVSFQQNKIAES